jgi:Pyruvate/2-oxoacid:ferredoxin oxidoreductase delta subunit
MMNEVSIKYDRLIIYYFSGTGNAKNASKWILKAAEEKGLSTQLINIDRFESVEAPDLSKRTLVGFCSPTHGFNVPPIVLKFIRKFPKIKNADAFILNTRAGMKLYKIFLPGLSGLAQILPAVVLNLKGFRIVGMQPLDLPSNWLLLHPGLRKKVITSIYDRCHRIVDDFACKMLHGSSSYKALYSLPIDIALIPIAVAYYFIGRFFLAKTLIATTRCDRCEECIIQCPVEAISIVSNRPFWSYACESCMRCVNACPKRAIETAHSFAITLLVISSLVISPLLMALLKQTNAWELVNQSIISQNIWSLIDAFIFLMFVFISYRILHYLMKFKPVNKIIEYTSLSRYKFWRRYRAPRN